MTLLDEMLIEGDDSLLHQELVQKRGITGNVNGGINQLGTPWNYKGPMLFITNFIYDPATSPETIVQAIDGAIEPLRAKLSIKRRWIERWGNCARIYMTRWGSSADLDWWICWRVLRCLMTTRGE